MRRVMSVLVGALSAMAVPVSTAGADDGGRGQCVVVDNGPSASGELQLIDLATDSKRVAIRKDGVWYRTIDASQTTMSISPSEIGATWIARVYPTAGARYDLSCEVQPPSPVNRTFCSATASDTGAAAVQLRFPNLDAKRVVVRRNDVWQATLQGSPDRWADEEPLVDGDYFIRVTPRSDGGRYDIPCNVRRAGFRERLADGTTVDSGLVPAPDVEFTDLSALPGLSRGAYSTYLSGDGSVVVLINLDVERGVGYRVVIDTGEVTRINGDMIGASVSHDGSEILYRRRGKLRIWELAPERPEGFRDRSIVDDPTVEGERLTANGEHVFFARADGDGYALFRLTLETDAVDQVPQIIDRRVGYQSSDDGNRVFVDRTREVIDLETGERFALVGPDEEDPERFFNHAIAGDGSIAIANDPYSSGEMLVTDLDTGDRRRFSCQVSCLVARLDEDGSRILLSDDEGEEYWIQDLETLDVIEAPWVSFSNGSSVDQEFTTRASGAGIHRPILG